MNNNRSKRKLKLIIEYDGTDFHGWQRQPDVRTVQEDIETALATILQEKTPLVGAGRTDAGVHALGQVAHFSTNNPLECESILNGSNSLLKEDVRILSVDEVPASFHARNNAKCRIYRYRLLKRDRPLQRRYGWFPGYSLDGNKIKPAVESLPGRHSFKSFSHAKPGEDGYVCHVIDAVWIEEANRTTFEITADRFMHKMVRGIVGALIDVGRGYMSADEFRILLEEPKRNGATRVVQPQGLTLVEVGY